MSKRDTEETTIALRSFQSAWLKAIDDYASRDINSEHCLQSSLYRHLKNILPNEFHVYVEAVVRHGNEGEPKKEKVVVDLIVCHKNVITLGIELKYIPRGKPESADIKKDISSLFHITAKKLHEDRVSIEMPRFLSADKLALELQIAPQRKLIFAAFCMKEAEDMWEKNFWKKLELDELDTGYWKRKNSFPPNFCVALAQTADNGKASPMFFGPAFDRLDSE